MTVGAVLILYATVVGFAGPVAFRRATWPVRAPRLGAAAILAAAWTVPLALVLAGVTVVLPTSALSADLGQLVGACLQRLRAAYGTPAAGLVTAGQVLSVTLLARIGWAAGRLAHRRRSEGRRQRLLLQLAGRPRADLSALVLDHPDAAAYSLAGRAPAVVVTSGAIALLTEPQLGAVLAHENAHLTARHHRRQTAAALLAAALPAVPLLREAPALVGRLLEMDADELAARRHEPRVLASALVAVAGGATRPGTAVRPTPASTSTSMAASAVGAAGADAVARIHRLLRPPAHLPRRRRTLTRAAVVALAITPLVLAIAPALAV
ncbi:M56 family metallopeptidase [Pseudonocardia sp. RS11V-5]|uniref:M56 family metallopeptidase n=1 Tax=Pseudonocardia terrae TaxID=2905831 RepID=UPI001E2F52EF|nr:M56 family metallopeptidase [Pseudonocardia terrae]MCE3551813.1 M56 family metallopeptidase [Pseudonocardia terrae]